MKNGLTLGFICFIAGFIVASTDLRFSEFAVVSLGIAVPFGLYIMLSTSNK